MPRSNNRTLWPVTGGAVGFQPGWFPGHSSALIYINLGDGTTPQNMSMPMQSVFAITGPTNAEYPGSVCMPQVPLPVNYTAVIGQNATIQVIETAQHGAALYNVSILFERGDTNFVANSNTAVRGHHLRQSQRRTRSQRDELLQHDRHRFPICLQHQ